MKLVVVTGVSGAGKSTALRALEDLGFYAADNLPLPLVPKFLELVSARAGHRSRRAGHRRARRRFLAEAPTIFADIKKRARRRGPVPRRVRRDPHQAVLRDPPAAPALRHRHRAGILEERGKLAVLRQAADALVDTGTLTVHVAARAHHGALRARRGRPQRTLLSFGFKHGIPVEADMVLDVRFLPNPFFVPQLSALSGEDEAVARFVLDDPETKPFVDKGGGPDRRLGRGLPARGQVLRDGRDRLHGRPASLGRHRQGAGQAARPAVLGLDPPPRHPARRGPVTG